MKILFSPKSSIKINASTTSQNAAIPAEKNVRVQNMGTVPVFIEFGTDDTVTATLSDLPIMNGIGPEMFRMPYGLTHVAAITETGAASVIFTFGEGE